MLKIELLKLESPKEYLESIEKVYLALYKKSQDVNDLRNFIKSSLMIKQILQAKDMLERHEIVSKSQKKHNYYYYNCPPFVYLVEDKDNIEEILFVRDQYVYNAAFA